MLFGEKPAATVLGKTLTGYADGSGDLEQQKIRPMARFLLDEPDVNGQGSLTLTVDNALYDRLLVGSHGRLSRLGSRCLDFIPDAEEEPAQTAPAAPPAEEGEVGALYTPPPIGDWAGAQPPPPPPSKAQMTCPWCGKPMTRWTLPSRDTLVLKRETTGDFSLKKWFQDREKNRIDLGAGGFGDSLLVHVCEGCKKAAIDYATPPVF